MKTLQDLKEFLNKLNPEQLSREAVVQFEERAVSITDFELTKEDYFYSKEYPEEGCFTKSDAGDDFDPEDSEISLPKNSAIIYGD